MYRPKRVVLLYRMYETVLYFCVAVANEIVNFVMVGPTLQDQESKL